MSNVSSVDHDDRVIVSTSCGAWTIYKQHIRTSDGRQVGPGYIARLRDRQSGLLVVEDLLPEINGEPWSPGSLNAPEWGGLGAFGWHHARGNSEEGRECDVRRTVALAGQGIAATTVNGPVKGKGIDAVYLQVVLLLDDWCGDRVMRVDYRYHFLPNRVEQTITVTQLWAGNGQQAWIKEPKVACCVDDHPILTVFDSADIALVRYDARTHRRLAEPRVATVQIKHPRRCRYRWSGGQARTLNIVARAIVGRSRDDWIGADGGLDQWAQRSNQRRSRPGESARYCLQGPPKRDDGPGGTTLTRQHELAARGGVKHRKLMLHGWEGGSDPADCPACYRAFGPCDESFAVWLCYSLTGGQKI